MHQLKRLKMQPLFFYTPWLAWQNTYSKMPPTSATQMANR